MTKASTRRTRRTGEKKRRGRINSAAKIAKLLSTEGWTDHLANECDRYIYSCLKTEARKLEAAKRRQEEASKILSALPDEHKQIVGKFISMHKGMSFEAGLRVGLGCAVHRFQLEDIEGIDL